jgi:glycosyltransferase involved in cell wall biosynthesis
VASDAALPSGPLWDRPEPELELTVVVPFHNPGARFGPNLDQLVEALASTGASFEVVAVSDGSTDGSAEEAARKARAAPGGPIRQVSLQSRRGKGEALRVGLATGRGRYLGFIDGDGDVAPDVLVPFVSLMRLYEPDVILGSKRHPMSQVDYPPARRLYSWGFQQLCRALFRLDVRDTQTGVKLVKREVLAEVLPLMVERRYAFDLELLVVAHHLGRRRFFEAPVRLEQRFSSTVDLGAVAATLVDTLAIFWRLRVRRVYTRPSGGWQSVESSAK